MNRARETLFSSMFLQSTFSRQVCAHIFNHAHFNCHKSQAQAQIKNRTLTGIIILRLARQSSALSTQTFPHSYTRHGIFSRTFSGILESMDLTNTT